MHNANNSNKFVKYWLLFSYSVKVVHRSILLLTVWFLFAILCTSCVPRVYTYKKLCYYLTHVKRSMSYRINCRAESITLSALFDHLPFFFLLTVTATLTTPRMHANAPILLPPFFSCYVYNNTLLNLTPLRNIKGVPFEQISQLSKNLEFPHNIKRFQRIQSALLPNSLVIFLLFANLILLLLLIL
jgi:hypothetical protein